MSEKMSKQDRLELTASVGNLVDVDKNGHAHVPAGSVGSDFVDANGKRHYTKGGSFLSDHELEMIEAHADQIHEGYAAREAQNMLEVIGDSTDPAEIREKLYDNGYPDDEEYEFREDHEEGDDPLQDDEIMQMVEKARDEAAGHNSEEYYALLDRRIGEQSQLDPSKEEGSPAEYIPKHRADVSDESSPLFDELATKYASEDDSGVRDGESLEEYETRINGGKHRADTGASDLEILDEGAVSATDLELLDETNDSSAKRRGFVVRARNVKNRVRDLTMRAAAETSARAYARGERSGDRRRNALVAILGGAAVAAVLAGMRLKGHDVTGVHFGGGSHTGSGDAPWKDYFQNKQPGAHQHGGGHGHNRGHETVSKIRELFGKGTIQVKPGDGYTQAMDRVLDAHNVHLSSNELYDLHKHLEHVSGEYIDINGSHDVYAMANGDSGLSHPDSTAHISKAAQKAAVDWLERHGKIA
jgi:hypothetical protein